MVRHSGEAGRLSCCLVFYIFKNVFCVHGCVWARAHGHAVGGQLGDTGSPFSVDRGRLGGEFPYQLGSLHPALCCAV